MFAVLALLTVAADAAKQVNDITDIDLAVFVPCADGGAGELVDLSGRLHTMIHFTINGNNVSGVSISSPRVSRARAKLPVINDAKRVEGAAL